MTRTYPCRYCGVPVAEYLSPVCNDCDYFLGYIGSEEELINKNKIKQLQEIVVRVSNQFGYELSEINDSSKISVDVEFVLKGCGYR